MKLFSLCLALAIAGIGGWSWAAQQDPHQGHHPATAKPAADPHPAPATAADPMSGEASADVARIDAKMKMMQEMHIKMMAAETPEERNAMMGDHMKAMQDGMAMMKGMSSGGMEMKCDMAANHQMMEKRMEMMEAMMQMMMDLLPASTQK